MAAAGNSVLGDAETVYDTAVADIQRQTKNLESSANRLNFYRGIIKELGQKYIPFLTDEQKETVRQCQKILDKWDKVHLPEKPDIIHVAQAAIFCYNAQFNKQDKCSKGGKRRQTQNQKKLAAAQLREKTFLQSVAQSMNQWQEGALEKCHLANEIDRHIDHLHSIVSMLDNRFHHNLGRFFADGAEGVAARNGAGTGSLPSDAAALAANISSRKIKKAKRYRPQVAKVAEDSVSKEELVTPTPVKASPEEDNDVEWDEKVEFLFNNKTSLEKELEDVHNRLEVLKLNGNKESQEPLIGDEVIVHPNLSRDVGTQTDYYDPSLFEDLDPSIPLFEVVDSSEEEEDSSESSESEKD